MPPATKLTAAEIKALYSDALSKVAAGRPEGALPVLGRIIEARPDLPEPLWQAAQILADFDRFGKALACATQAALLKPAEPVVWATWADIVALSGDKTAEQAFLDALKGARLPPASKIRLADRFGAQRRDTRPDTMGLPQATLAQAGRLSEDGDLQQAQKLVSGLLERHPRHAVLHNMLASIKSRTGQGAQAVQSLRMAQKLDPYYAEAWVNEAREWRRQQRIDDALPAYRGAIARAPANEKALLGYATLLNQTMQADRARPFAERLVALYPKSVAAQIALGNTLTLLRDYAGAEAALAKAVTLSRGKSAEALMLLAQAISHLGRDEEALVLVDRSLALKPDYMLALDRKALILQTLGRFGEAEPLFRRALELAPSDGELWRGFVTGFKVKPDDPVIPQMQDRIGDPTLDDTARAGFAFALGKALEDVKRHTEAFGYIRQANDLVRKIFPYDMGQRREEVDALQRAIRGFDWQGTDVPNPSDAAPIFVTGMARSGTTLVEQIIASHPRVTGAGELALLQTACQRLLTGGRSIGSDIRPLRDVPLTDIAQVGHEFLREVAARFPDADIITDKSISTYMYIGLVRLILPNARIVVVRRDPRDMLLSIYKNRFPEGTHLYAYDLRDLAQYYATFVEVVDFWRAETPDWFTEVQYETLVANPEEESRRLIAACGLDWDDACLKSHENTRKVDTLSVYQVRQPISRNSVKAWQRYEQELAPMIEVLTERGLLPD